MGVCVGVSVGEGVSVGRRVGVSVSMGMGVKVAVLGMFVDVEAGCGEDDAGICPELQASVARIKDVIKGRSLFFIALIVLKSPLVV